MRTEKALARLRGCAGAPEPSLVAYVISTIISRADANNLCMYMFLQGSGSGMMRQQSLAYMCKTFGENNHMESLEFKK